jgi:hypothetical protein
MNCGNIKLLELELLILKLIFFFFNNKVLEWWILSSRNLTKSPISGTFRQN